jgi:hypothetical protein
MATKKKTEKKEVVVKKEPKMTCLACPRGDLSEPFVFENFEKAVEVLLEDYVPEEIENDFAFYLVDDGSIKFVSEFSLVPKGFNIEVGELKFVNDGEV